MAEGPGGQSRPGRRGPRDPEQPQNSGSSKHPKHRSAQRPAERGRTADAPRRAAYTLLRAVDSGAYANLELPRILRDLRLDGRDAAFATELAYGALRWQGRYDPMIEIAASRELAAIDAAVVSTLRLGVHQILGMRVPAHAAVAETVALARQVNGAGAAGFVNAVLRRVSERPLDAWIDAVSGTLTDPLARLAVTESHPLWIVKALRAALLGHGAATQDTVGAELAATLSADNEPARVALVARPGLATVDELVSAGAEPGRWAPTAATLVGGDPAAIRAVRDGRAAVQDEGSQLVTLALAHAPLDPVAGDRPECWLDLCAGPGGKAGLLAALALERGASVVANEISDHRAELVRKTLRPAIEAGGRGQVDVWVGDGRAVGRDHPDEFDRVLVDAPCTGLGALRRRPEARWRKQPSDVAQLATLQRELLGSALDAVRPGGVVAYVTCSPHLVETRFAVTDVVKKRSDIEVLDAQHLVVDRDGTPVPGMGAPPFVQLWPHRHGTDAMFLALLRRTT